MYSVQQSSACWKWLGSQNYAKALRPWTTTSPHFVLYLVKAQVLRCSRSDLGRSIAVRAGVPHVASNVNCTNGWFSVSIKIYPYNKRAASGVGLTTLLYIGSSYGPHFSKARFPRKYDGSEQEPLIGILKKQLVIWQYWRLQHCHRDMRLTQFQTCSFHFRALIKCKWNAAELCIM